jgi:hypothetical protein
VYKYALGDPLGVAKSDVSKLQVFSIGQNFPNPFNPKTNFDLRISRPTIVSLKVFDLAGKDVATLVNQRLSSGVYQVTWDASKAPSGIYFYRFATEETIETGKMVLIK